MTRLMLAFTSLALVSVACGRVGLSNNFEADESAGGSTSRGGGDTASGGAAASTGGSRSATAGASSAGMVGAGRGGAPTTTDPGVGAAPSGGTRALGGDAGSGGGSGAWPDAKTLCTRYCRAFSDACPQAGANDFNQCTSECVTSLVVGSAACSDRRAAAFGCIADALARAPGDCGTALELATRLCGGEIPTLDCNVACIPDPSFGGGTSGCHATAECNDTTVDVNCRNARGGVLCSCSLDGREIWLIGAPFVTAKDGCLDAEFFKRCALELP
jgi:hypothetical protein